MRITSTMMIAVMAMGMPSVAVAKKKSEPVRYEYDGRYYDSIEECREKKRNAKKDGAIVGAAVAGVGAAVLGANLGETALIAGGGALVGNQLGKSKKC